MFSLILQASMCEKIDCGWEALLYSEKEESVSSTLLLCISVVVSVCSGVVNGPWWDCNKDGRWRAESRGVRGPLTSANFHFLVTSDQWPVVTPMYLMLLYTYFGVCLISWTISESLRREWTWDWNYYCLLQ